MLRIEIKNKIKNMLNEKDVYSYKELVDILNISLSTIKRHSEELQKEGLLKLVRGGISSIVTTELTNVVKSQENKKAKIAVAKKAIGLISDGMTIFLDAGTTTMAIASLLKNQKITVVTNNIDIVYIMAKKNIKTIVIEGQVRMNTMAITGTMAMESIKKFNFSVSFLGCNGIEGKNIYTTNSDEASVKRMIIDNSINSYIVCDKSKINKNTAYIFANKNETKVLTN